MNLDRLDTIKTDKNIKKDKFNRFVIPGDAVIYGNKYGIHFDIVMKNTPSGIRLFNGGLVHSSDIMKVSSTKTIAEEFGDIISTLEDKYKSLLDSQKEQKLHQATYVITTFEMKKDPSKRGFALFLFNCLKKDLKANIQKYFSKRNDANFRFLSFNKKAIDSFVYKFSEPGDAKSAKLIGNGLVNKLWGFVGCSFLDSKLFTKEMLDFGKLAKECGLVTCKFQYLVNETILNEYPELVEKLKSSESRFIAKGNVPEYSIPFQGSAWPYTYCNLMLTDYEGSYDNTLKIQIEETGGHYSWSNADFIIPEVMRNIIITNFRATDNAFLTSLSSYYWEGAEPETKAKVKAYYKYLIETVTGKEIE